MERAAAIEATGAPPNKRTLAGGTKKIRKIKCIGSLFNVVRLFVLFDLISSGSRKNDNLWKSRGGIMVNGAPREVSESSQWSP